MDFNSTILRLPHVAKLIFEDLNRIQMRNCSKVCKAWREFLERSKFYWVKLTKDQPGWKKLPSLVDFETFVSLGKAFEEIVKFGGRTKRRKIHPCFCAIQMNDLKLFKKLIWEYADDDCDYKCSCNNVSLVTKSMSGWSLFDFARDIGRNRILRYMLKKDPPGP